MSTPALPDDLLARLSTFVATHIGLHFPPAAWGELGRGIASAAQELGFADDAAGARWLLAPAVVLCIGTRRIAFLVEAVLGEQEVLVKDLGPQLVRVRNITGATILGNGKVVP